MWFSVFVEATKVNFKFNNPAGWVAAIEYVWYQLRDEKKSQACSCRKTLYFSFNDFKVY